MRMKKFKKKLRKMALKGTFVLRVPTDEGLKKLKVIMVKEK
nr:MAG: hypothetical protein [uncultured archaeon]